MSKLQLDVNHVYAPESVDGSEGLLVSIYRLKDPDGHVPDGAHFLTGTDSPLQAAFISHGQGGVVEPHYHPQHNRQMTGTPEVLMVVGGRYRLDVYTSAGDWVSDHALSMGDVVVIRSGGHGLVGLDDENALFEVKVGPYLHDLDKVRFQPKV